MKTSISNILPVGLIILTSIFSCSKKTDAVVVQPCAVTKISATTSFTGGAQTVSNTSYTYNSDQTLAQATEAYSSTAPGVTPYSRTTVTNYTYNGGALATVAAGNALATWTNTNGAVTKISGSTGDAASLFLITETISYDGQGKLAATNYQDNLGLGTKVNTTYTFDASSNLQSLKREIISGGVSQGVINSTYTSFDGKNNPYALLAKAIKQPYFFTNVFGDPNEMVLSKNNIVTSSSGGIGVTNSYEYSDAGYPTKITQTGLGFTITTLIEYQLCK